MVEQKYKQRILSELASGAGGSSNVSGHIHFDQDAKDERINLLTFWYTNSGTQKHHGILIVTL